MFSHQIAQELFRRGCSTSRIQRVQLYVISSCQCWSPLVNTRHYFLDKTSHCHHGKFISSGHGVLLLTDIFQQNQYPQLDNLYPAPSESQPGSQPQQGQQKPPQPAAGPGAGFARPPPTHQVPFGGNNGGFANYSAVGGSSGRSHGGGHDAGEKNVAQLIVDKSNAFQRT